MTEHSNGNGSRVVLDQRVIYTLLAIISVLAAGWGASQWVDGKFEKVNEKFALLQVEVLGIKDRLSEPICTVRSMKQWVKTLQLQNQTGWKGAPDFE